MERIRYRSISETAKESMQTFGHPTNGAQYKVRLNLLESQWLVVDAHTEVVAASGTNVNKAKLQREVRNALISLGANLSKEKRVRTPKVQQ